MHATPGGFWCFRSLAGNIRRANNLFYSPCIQTFDEFCNGTDKPRPHPSRFIIKSIGRFISDTKGFTSGFDYLRLTLSISVLVWHSYVFTHEQKDIDKALAGPAGIFIYLILPMFFALSGFLVASSLIRVQNLSTFLWLRFVRLFPALAVEVFLSALILGPMATSLTPGEYFSNPAFWTYFSNLAGIVQLHLPGVFENNPAAAIVNGSLWTVPYELECYIALSILFLIGLVWHPRILGALFILAILVRTFLHLYKGAPPLPADHLTGRQLILLFMAGIVIYLNRDIVPKNNILAVALIILGAALIRSPQFYLLAILPLAYGTAHLGLLNPVKNMIISKGDYSYGIYLYAAPIQQATYYFSEWGKTYTGNLLLSAGLTFAFAALSWHTIEKPALRFKRRLVRPAIPAQ